jgi:RNA polymerase-binding transcription factor DksA
MTAHELLTALEAHGVRVQVTGDRLRLVPAKAVTAELLAAAREHKREIITILTTLEFATPVECAWCGDPLAPYRLELAGRPALLCLSCERWTLAGGAA